MDINLSDVLAECWTEITVASQTPGHPLRNIIIAHAGSDAYVNAYTVVLRTAPAAHNKVIFFTDYRSPKVGQILKGNSLTILGYNATDKVQLILKGEAVVHYQNDLCLHYWETEGHKSPKSYSAQPAPSSVIGAADDGLAYLNEQEPDSTDAYANFAVVEIAVNKIEYLKLSHEGNYRAKFDLQSNGSWQGSWLIP